MAASSEAKEITIVREFAAPRELVWKVWTEPHHIEKWWGPRGFDTRVKKVELSVAGQFVYVMTGPDGTEYPVSGKIIEIIPFEKIVSTDEFGDGEGNEHPGIDLPQGLILTVLFEDLGGSTRMTLTISHPTAQDRKRHEAMGVVGGWNSSFDKMDEYLAELQ